MKRVLILDGEHRIALALAKAFHRRGYGVDLASTKPLPRGFFSRYCHRKIRYRPDDLSSLILAIHEQPYSLIVPVLDASYSVAYELIDRGIQGMMPLPPKTLFDAMQDKASALSMLQAYGQAIPATYRIEEFMALRNNHGIKNESQRFLIKPRISSSARGIVVFEGTLGFDAAYEQYQKQTQDLSGKFDGCVLRDPIVQEYVDGENFSLNMIFRNGKLYFRQLVHHMRYYPNTFGSPIRSRTFSDNSSLLESLARFFETIGWHGVVHCDLIRTHHEGEYRVNEVNPRFWGTMSNTLQSGADIVTALEALSQDTVSPPMISPTDYGYEYRHLFFGEIAYLYRSKHKCAAFRELVTRPGDRKIFWGFDPTDPGPLAAQLINLFTHKEVI
ncbi:MAG: ATP-grasp domain-containing protein [Candidatus Omnitrophota bacterium]